MHVSNIHFYALQERHVKGSCFVRCSWDTYKCCSESRVITCWYTLVKKYICNLIYLRYRQMESWGNAETYEKWEALWVPSLIASCIVMMFMAVCDICYSAKYWLTHNRAVVYGIKSLTHGFIVFWVEKKKFTSLTTPQFGTCFSTINAF